MSIQLSRRGLIAGSVGMIMAGTPLIAGAVPPKEFDAAAYYALSEDDMLWLRQDANAFRGQLVSFVGDLGGASKIVGFDGQDIDGVFGAYTVAFHSLNIPGESLNFMTYLVTKKVSDLPRKGFNAALIYGEVVGVYAMPYEVDGLFTLPVIEAHRIDHGKQE